MVLFEAQSKQIMTALTVNSTFSILLKLDDEVDDAALLFKHIWAYFWKLFLCSDYSKFWTLHSNFLLHLQKQEVHITTTVRPAAHCTIEIEWRYITNLHLPLHAASNFWSQKNFKKQVWMYSFKNNIDRVLTHTNRQRQISEKLQRTERRDGVMLVKLNTLWNINYLSICTWERSVSVKDENIKEKEQSKKKEKKRVFWVVMPS